MNYHKHLKKSFSKNFSSTKRTQVRASTTSNENEIDNIIRKKRKTKENKKIKTKDLVGTSKIRTTFY